MPEPARRIRFDCQAVEYRFNGLDAAAGYRIGIVTYDNTDQRKFDLVLIFSSGRADVELAKGVAAPSAARGRAAASALVRRSARDS